MGKANFGFQRQSYEIWTFTGFFIIMCKRKAIKHRLWKGMVKHGSSIKKSDEKISRP